MSEIAFYAKEPHPFTYDDYRTAPGDERYELLDGNLIMVPTPNLKHQTLMAALRAATPTA